MCKILFSPSLGYQSDFNTENYTTTIHVSEKAVKTSLNLYEHAEKQYIFNPLVNGEKLNFYIVFLHSQYINSNLRHINKDIISYREILILPGLVFFYVNQNLDDVENVL